MTILTDTDDNEAPPERVLTVQRVDDEVFLQFATYRESSDRTTLLPEGRQFTVDRYDMFRALGADVFRSL